MRFLLLTYLVVYLAAAFVLPSYRVWKRTGDYPVTFSGADSPHDYIGRLFKAVMCGLSGLIVIQAFVPELSIYLLPVFWLQHSVIQLVGAGLLIVFLVWTMLAQYQMGNSWRIGIDEEKKTQLVRTGVFGISRNPIFLGMIGTLLGFFFVIPNAFTLLFLALGFVLIQIQVRLEEEFLTGIHGSDYEDFRQQVRRWI